MGYNIRLVDDIIDHYDQAQKKGLIFMADFSKAFDSLEWDLMLKTLDFFNFGPSLKQWVKTIYNSPVCKIKNNGHLSAGDHDKRHTTGLPSLIFNFCSCN